MSYHLLLAHRRISPVGAYSAGDQVTRHVLEDAASIETSLQQVAEYTELVMSQKRAAAAPLAAAMAAAAQKRLIVSWTGNVPAWLAQATYTPCMSHGTDEA